MVKNVIYSIIRQGKFLSLQKTQAKKFYDLQSKSSLPSRIVNDSAVVWQAKKFYDLQANLPRLEESRAILPHPDGVVLWVE